MNRTFNQSMRAVYVPCLTLLPLPPRDEHGFVLVGSDLDLDVQSRLLRLPLVASTGWKAFTELSLGTGHQFPLASFHRSLINLVILFDLGEFLFVCRGRSRCVAKWLRASVFFRRIDALEWIEAWE